MKRNTIIALISYAFILLFLYTAISKLIVYERSLDDLHRSPFIGQYASPLSILLPVVEIIISVCLFLPRFRKIGLYGAAGLMTIFVIYVGIMVFTLKSLPCSCGGLIRELTWKQHFFFNIFFTIVAFLGIWLDARKSRSISSELNTA